MIIPWNRSPLKKHTHPAILPIAERYEMKRKPRWIPAPCSCDRRLPDAKRVPVLLPVSPSRGFLALFRRHGSPG